MTEIVRASDLTRKHIGWDVYDDAEEKWYEIQEIKHDYNGVIIDSIYSEIYATDEDVFSLRPPGERPVFGDLTLLDLDTVLHLASRHFDTMLEYGQKNEYINHCAEAILKLEQAIRDMKNV